MFAAKSLEGTLIVVHGFFVVFYQCFCGLPDPHPDPFVTSTDPDPSIIKKNSKKNLDFYCLVTSF